MRVLLLGVTGRVGSRLLPALLAHKHQVVAYVRNPSKLPQEVTSRVSAVVTGSGTDSTEIKSAILSNNCDAVVNAAGLAPILSKSGSDLPSIFAAITQAATEARQERSSEPLRCWFLSGWSMLDSPKPPQLILEYIPIYPMHKPNYDLIRSITPDQLAWSLFCASNMPPRSEAVNYSASAGAGSANLIAKADVPPAWSMTMQWVQAFGTYLNIMAQANGYYTPLEDCVDFIARDLTAGLESEFVGKRTGVKVKKT